MSTSPHYTNQINGTGKFSRVLIANRGEIAMRVNSAARKLGYETVAVFSEVDRDALHVQSADTAVCIGAASARDSYLCIDKIIEACKKSGANAVHPGYGFLSENAAFAQACLDNNIVFIGPQPASITAMGNKAAAKELMAASGVRCVPGYQGKEQAPAFLLARAAEIGFPIMVKAEAGGGGRGLRIAHSREELAALLPAARIEAERSFSCGNLLLERAIASPRHIEIQIFADSHGNVIHLGERDCSIQRRHQKVIEESPSPAVDEQLRNKIGEAAIQAARAINYLGAGTVEFLLDQNGEFYFMEMNTRLQVEHPVTEMITGIDLVEWQLRVASGERLPLTQEQVQFKGHAIEARLYAEDPNSEFMPQIGSVLHWQPPVSEGVRVDHGLKTCDEVSSFYDPMVAKIISFGDNREAARRRLQYGLSKTMLLGIKSNREFLLECLNQPAFIKGNFSTDFVKKFWQPKQAITAEQNSALLAMAAAIMLLVPSTTHRTTALSSRKTHPQMNEELFAWTNSSQMISFMKLQLDDFAAVEVAVRFKQNQIQLEFLNHNHSVQIMNLSDHSAEILLDGTRTELAYCWEKDVLHCSTTNKNFQVQDIIFQPRTSVTAATNSGEVFSPSNGLLASIEVQPGQEVAKGDPLFTIDAMKLLQTITAPCFGKVAAVMAQPGNQIKAKQLIVQIEAQEPCGSSESSASKKPSRVEVEI